jgi:hypothetical protein
VVMKIKSDGFDENDRDPTFTGRTGASAVSITDFLTEIQIRHLPIA